MQKKHSAELNKEVERLRRRLEAADERQRELHVLLLHRDKEIARLHRYVEQALLQHDDIPVIAGSVASRELTAPRRPQHAVPLPEAAILLRLEAGGAEARRWWNHLVPRRP